MAISHQLSAFSKIAVGYRLSARIAISSQQSAKTQALQNASLLSLRGMLTVFFAEKNALMADGYNWIT